MTKQKTIVVIGSLRVNMLYLPKLMGQTGLSKQCTPRSNAMECGILSWSVFFDIHPDILDTLTGSKIDLF